MIVRLLCLVIGASACDEAGRAPDATATEIDLADIIVAETVVSDTSVETVAVDASSGCAATLCEDFESGLRAPWSDVAPNCSGSGSLVIGDVAHTGLHGLTVSGGGSYCDHLFLQAPITASGPLYARFWVRLEAPLGQGHTTFVALHDASRDKDLRLGGQSEILMWNRESDDATLPVLSPAGIAQSIVLSAARWTCIELRVDGVAGTIDTWVDEDPIVGLTVDDSATADIDQQWHNDPSWHPQLVTFGLGWEAYAGQAMTLHFDDVTIGSERVRCGR